MYAEESARTFSLRVFDCRECLFDELAAGDFLAGKQLGKFDYGHCAEFMSSPTLRENRLDAPESCTGKSKPAKAGGVLQKVATLLIHVCSSSFVKILVRKEGLCLPAQIDQAARSLGQT
jgi:hypothetical protein